VQIFLKSKFAFQKCTWLKKSDNAPHSRRRRCGEAAFLDPLRKKSDELKKKYGEKHFKNTPDFAFEK